MPINCQKCGVRVASLASLRGHFRRRHPDAEGPVNEHPLAFRPSDSIPRAFLPAERQTYRQIAWNALPESDRAKFRSEHGLRAALKPSRGIWLVMLGFVAVCLIFLFWPKVGTVDSRLVSRYRPLS